MAPSVTAASIMWPGEERGACYTQAPATSVQRYLGRILRQQPGSVMGSAYPVLFLFFYLLLLRHHRQPEQLSVRREPPSVVLVQVSASEAWQCGAADAQNGC